LTLDRWLRHRRMTEAEFAAKVDGTCTQSLVSKWRRGMVMPSPERVDWIEALTGGAVTARGLAEKVARTRARKSSGA